MQKGKSRVNQGELAAGRAAHSRDEDLLRVVDGLFADHDDAELHREFDQTPAVLTLKPDSQDQTPSVLTLKQKLLFAETDIVSSTLN